MNRGKKIEVSASKLVDLKAELYRKQQELKQNRGPRPNVVKNNAKFVKKVKPLLDSLGKSNPGVEARLAKDQQSQISNVSNEDRDALEASRKKLEEKAKLYEKIMTATDFQDEDELYMVDFQRKAMNENIHKVPTPTINTSSDTKPDEEEEEEVDETSYHPKDQSEEWVDYVDSLGRSRLCLKRDLPQMISMDEDLKKRKTEMSPQHDTHVDEADEEEDTDGTGWDTLTEVQQTPTGPVHYQNVQHNEKRTHGVGYYAFSQSAEERTKQMEMLNQLRNQTKEQRVRSEKLKEKRQAALKARLQKVKQRKKLQSGGTLSDSDESNKEDEKTNLVEQVIAAEGVQESTSSVEVSEEKKDKPTSMRPWDRGKIGPVRIVQPFKKASQKEWVEKQRDGRNPEFAPPQFYHKRDHVEEMRQFFMKQQQQHHHHARMDPNDDGIGPEWPTVPDKPFALFTTTTQGRNEHVPPSVQLDNIPLPSDT